MSLRLCGGVRGLRAVASSAAPCVLDLGKSQIEPLQSRGVFCVKIKYDEPILKGPRINPLAFNSVRTDFFARPAGSLFVRSAVVRPFVPAFAKALTISESSHSIHRGRLQWWPATLACIRGLGNSEEAHSIGFKGEVRPLMR
jgi:hypothetical protein